MYIAPPEAKSLMIFVHLVLMPFLLFSVSILAFLKIYPSFILLVHSVGPVVAAVGNIVILSNLEGYSIYFTEIYLIILWIFTVSSLKFQNAVISSLIIVIISVFSSYYIFELQNNELIMHIFWLLASFSLGFIGAYILETSNKTVFLKQEELEYINSTLENRIKIATNSLE
jgi:hypothetical protein